MAAADFVERGIALELVDGHKLFNLLDIYSDPTLTPRELAAIFSEDHSRSG
jgi:hypothetical protein